MAKKPMKKRIKNDLIYFHVMWFVKLLRALPRRTSVTLMNLLAVLAYRVASHERKKTITHLRTAFGHKSDEEINRIAKSVFINISTVAADSIRLPQIVKNDINTLVDIQGREYIDNSLANGNGIIVLTAHFGAWELLGAWLAQNNYPTKVVARTAYDERLDQLIVETRNKAGYYNIARGRNTREIIKSLRQGYIIGMLIDQDTKVEGIYVKFFDQWAHTAVGPAILAKKYNVPVVPVFIRLKPDKTYQIDAFPPLPFVNTENKQADLKINIQMCSDIYEKVIRKYPDQWVWMHERWKKQPTTEN